MKKQNTASRNGRTPTRPKADGNRPRSASVEKDQNASPLRDTTIFVSVSLEDLVERERGRGQ